MYSTIRVKKGNCTHPGCNYHGPLTNKLCPTHYWGGIRLKSAAKFEEKELANNESLSSVMDDLDAIFSQWVRLKGSDENGYCRCYCCGTVFYYTDGDCGHYMPRIHKNTRYSEDNCKECCRECNQRKDGNLQAFGEHLERDRPGLVEALEDQARVRYDYDVPELKGLIAYYSKEVKVMKAKKPLKI